MTTHRELMKAIKERENLSAMFVKALRKIGRLNKKIEQLEKELKGDGK